MRYMFFIILIAVMAAANYYVLNRIWHMIPPIQWLRIAIVGFGVLAFVAMLVSVLAGDNLPAGVTGVMYKVGTSWLFIMLYLLIAFLILDLLRVTHLLPVEKIKYRSWTGLIGMTVLMFAVFITGNIIYHNKKRVEFTVDTGGMISRPYKIVMASDLHLGYGIGQKELDKWVGMINAENPDVILFAGDIIDNSVHAVQGLWQSIRKFSPKLGMYGVPGNHEYISGIDKSMEFFKRSRIQVLKDSRVLVNGEIYLVGRDDKTNSRRAGVSELMADIDKTKPVILLDHQPDEINQAVDAGVLLQLSGHTHHGQVWPFNWITNAVFEDSYGLMEKNGTKIYVSSGLGLWGGKFRIGSRSEYVVINLI